MTEAVSTQPPTASPALSFTDQAAERLQAEMDRQDGVDALRLLVMPGGCAGLQYALSMAKGEPEEVETVVRDHDIDIYVQADMLELLEGSIIRFNDNLIGGGFQVDNPNASQECGCGKSFS